MPWLSSTRPTVPVARSPNVATSRALRRSSPHMTVTTPSRSPSSRCGKLVRPDVQLAVPEAIDPQHLGVDPVRLGPRQGDHPGHEQGAVERRAEVVEIDAVAQVGCRWSEHVPAGEGRSRCLEVITGVVELDRPRRPAGEGDGRGEQAVVRADEHAGAVGDLDGDRLAARADSGIDDCDDDPIGEVWNGPGQRQRSAAHIERADRRG